MESVENVFKLIEMLVEKIFELIFDRTHNKIYYRSILFQPSLFNQAGLRTGKIMTIQNDHERSKEA